jgi:hypothetical protein
MSIIRWLRRKLFGRKQDSTWVRIFENSPANGARTNFDDMPEYKWEWPKKGGKL